VNERGLSPLPVKPHTICPWRIQRLGFGISGLSASGAPSASAPTHGRMKPNLRRHNESFNKLTTKLLAQRGGLGRRQGSLLLRRASRSQRFTKRPGFLLGLAISVVCGELLGAIRTVKKRYI
jgi:hypothetical protein